MSLSGAPLVLQAELFGEADPAPTRPLDGLVRHRLDADAWVDHLPGWLDGSDRLFGQLVDVLPWERPQVAMYDRMLEQPRMTARWAWDDPPPGLPGVVADMARVVGAHYGVELATVVTNLYRDGRDSVAWHGDRIGRLLSETIVVIVSLGERRRFLLRPLGGGPSRRFDLGRGDLLVMGGTCQRTWQHCVPKVARAGPRISVTFRERWA